ncbi:MAG: hypothetical protein PVH68_20030 [Armatimonadota bacterium]
MSRSTARLAVMLMTASAAQAAEPIDIGSRLELFVDDYLIERIGRGARRVLHHPIARDLALVRDAPWEGNSSGYTTVFRDGELYRMYYRGSHLEFAEGKYSSPHREVVCYAESDDGIHWTRPELGLVEFDGSKQNNIILDGRGAHCFTPFKDANPNCKPEARYKAVGRGEKGKTQLLFAFHSPDAIHWSPVSDEPVITQGAFDSQNVAFWDSLRAEYRAYVRDFRDGRDIRTCTSQDFVHWTEPEFLSYSPGRVSQLYTNQVIPYYRAPHIFLGFPTRYLDHEWAESTKALPQLERRQLVASSNRRLGTAITDGMFMSSRDATTFCVWPESFIRPGLRTRDAWFYGDNYQNWGLVETQSHIDAAPDEISIYVTEAARHPRGNRLRRFTIRVDGFVSVQAPLSGGELVTKPLVFSGSLLEINFSTSAAGSIRIEAQDESGTPIPGFALDDCPLIFGDALERTVTWKGGTDIGQLAGRPVRLRFQLRDADLYALRFR